MKQKEFLEKYPDEKIEVPLYFITNDKREVKIDFEGLSKEFNRKLKNILIDLNQLDEIWG